MPYGSNSAPLYVNFLPSQESRQKRDEFLKQMSSFLKGIEDSGADVVPPEPPTSLVDIDTSPGVLSSFGTLTSSAPPRPLLAVNDDVSMPCSTWDGVDIQPVPSLMLEPSAGDHALYGVGFREVNL